MASLPTAAGLPILEKCQIFGARVGCALRHVPQSTAIRNPLRAARALLRFAGSAIGPAAPRPGRRLEAPIDWTRIFHDARAPPGILGFQAASKTDDLSAIIT